ncbi:MAG: ATP-binding cassette domain-containing protein, partial [Pseudomonadota bacterium]|nr:ATP-binding cassette domain-containing protein [Pseudomonadota bacterium]
MAPEPMADIRFEHVSTLYGGKDEQAALALLHAGADAATLRAQAGASVGLNQLSLHIPSGGLFCVMGLSGSGKSTLVRHINGLITPSQGRVCVGDTVVNQLDNAALRHFRQHRVSMVFQHFGLLPHLTVLQNVCYGLRVRGTPAAQAHEAARHWLAEVDLPQVEARYPDELSGGMKQRVGLARALAVDTPVLLMDEA